MQEDVAEAYQQSHPGQVQVLGVEVNTGTAGQVQVFRDLTGITFPILLAGGAALGGNLNTLYGPRHNFIVISKQGIVRINTYPGYAHGARWHVEEIRGCIDSLVSTPVAVEAAPIRALSLSSLPNPTRHTSMVELVLPERARGVRVGVFDLSGRSIRSLATGDFEPGTHRWTWDGSNHQGEFVRAGIYLIRATVEGKALSRRITRLE